MAKYKVKALSAVIGGKKWIAGQVLDTAKLPGLKVEIANAAESGFLVDLDAKKEAPKGGKK